LWYCSPLCLLTQLLKTLLQRVTWPYRCTYSSLRWNWIVNIWSRFKTCKQTIMSWYGMSAVCWTAFIILVPLLLRYCVTWPWTAVFLLMVFNWITNIFKIFCVIVSFIWSNLFLQSYVFDYYETTNLEIF